MVNKALELVRVLAAERRDDDQGARHPSGTAALVLLSDSPLAGGAGLGPSAPGRRHELSLGLLPVLEPLRRFEALAEVVNPVIRALALATRLTVKVTVRQGDDAVTIARCESPQGTSVGVRVGAAFPLAYGSSGAVLLCDLRRDEAAGVLNARRRSAGCTRPAMTYRAGCAR